MWNAIFKMLRFHVNELMEDPAGIGALRGVFDRRLKQGFHRGRITFGADVLVHRELNDALG